MSKKLTSRQRIKYRIRRRIKGTPRRPRLAVYRSNKEIYCQVIDDLSGRTLASASSLDDSVDKNVTKIEQSKVVGKVIGEQLKSMNLDEVVFDRAGYLYHGRVKALAEGAREAGVKL